MADLPSSRSRDSLIDAGLALARVTDLDGALHELGHQLRRHTPAQDFGIWLLPTDGSPALRFAHGASEAGTTTERLEVLAQEALSSQSGLAISRHGGLTCMAAAMRDGSTALGAVALATDMLAGPSEREAAGRLLIALGTQAAITVDRVRRAELVSRQQRMEAVAGVAAGVARELRSFLFGVSSAAQLLRFRAREDVVMEKNVGRILREIDRLGKLVGALSEFGEPGPLVLTAGDPDSVWDKVLEGQRGLLEARSLMLRRVVAEPRARARIDPEHLARVFVHLLANAAEHAPPASDLTLVSSHTPGVAWTCRLTNPGPVLPSEALDRAFELFYSTRPGATGLGLALSDRVVQLHGGRLEISSSMEHGTTLTLSLPLTVHS
jgi:signal transduction histidine kinase